MRSAVLAELGSYNEAFHYAQDYELWSRISRTREVAALPDALISYRRTASSLTATYAGAAAEIESISAANIEWVFATSGRATDDVASLDRETAWRLLFGDARGLDPRAASEVTPIILEIQTAFASAFRLSARAGRRHRAATARHIARRLGRLGLGSGDTRALTAAGRLLLLSASG